MGLEQVAPEGWRLTVPVSVDSRPERLEIAQEERRVVEPSRDLSRAAPRTAALQWHRSVGARAPPGHLPVTAERLPRSLSRPARGVSESKVRVSNAQGRFGGWPSTGARAGVVRSAVFEDWRSGASFGLFKVGLGGVILAA